MNKKITIELPEAVLLRAKERAKKAGYEKLDAYLGSLIREDLDFDLNQEWIRRRIEEGIASGNAGLLTEDKIHWLVDQGVARATSKSRPFAP
jgi:predicted transcriptional regulator